MKDSYHINTVYDPKEIENIFLDYILVSQRNSRTSDHLLPAYFLVLSLGLYSWKPSALYSENLVLMPLNMNPSQWIFTISMGS